VYSQSEDALYVVGTVVRAQNLHRFFDGSKRKRQSGSVDEVLPVASRVQMVLHAVDVCLQSAVTRPDDRLHTRREFDVVETFLDRVDGRPVTLWRVVIDMDADDVVGPVDGTQEAYELVRLAVRQDVVGDRKVGRFRVDHVAEASTAAERGAVSRLVDDVFVADRRPGEVAGYVGGEVVQLRVVAAQNATASDASTRRGRIGRRGGGVGGRRGTRLHHHRGKIEKLRGTAAVERRRKDEAVSRKALNCDLSDVDVIRATNQQQNFNEDVQEQHERRVNDDFD